MYTHPAVRKQTHPPWCRCPCPTKLFVVPSLSLAHKKDGTSWETPFPAKYHPWCPYLYSVGDWPYRRPVISISTQILFSLVPLKSYTWILGSTLSSSSDFFAALASSGTVMFRFRRASGPACCLSCAILVAIIPANKSFGTTMFSP